MSSLLRVGLRAPARMYSAGLGGGGWIDLGAAAKITTLLGGALETSSTPTTLPALCPKWRAVPIGLDHMAASYVLLGCCMET